MRTMTNLQSTIEQAWENRALLQEETTQKAMGKKSSGNVLPYSKNGNLGIGYF